MTPTSVLETVEVGPRPGARAFAYIGVPLLAFGILLLIAASVAASGAASFNAGCAKTPTCVPSSDPRGGLADGGAVLLLIGLVLLGYGVLQYSKQ